MPDDPDNYYRFRYTVPSDMLGDIVRPRWSSPTTIRSSAARRWTCPRPAKSLLQGRGEAPKTTETEGQMLQRACGDLFAMKNVVVVNDEAHHCYEERPYGSVEEIADAVKNQALGFEVPYRE